MDHLNQFLTPFLTRFLTPFLTMGGYGLYVWLSYALALGLLAFLGLKSWFRWRQLKTKLSHDE